MCSKDLLARKVALVLMELVGGLSHGGAPVNKDVDDQIINQQTLLKHLLYTRIQKLNSLCLPGAYILLWGWGWYITCSQVNTYRIYRLNIQ